MRRTKHSLILACVAVCCSVAFSGSLRAEDWPTYQHDNRRSGVTAEQLRLPLTRTWEYCSQEPPQTAWAGPAKWDAFASLGNLKSMRNFDPVFYVTGVQGSVFFGSSVDDAVHCLDLQSGREKWVHFTNGPVRLPPSFSDGRLYFGSDDGCAYCIGADSGQSIWRYDAVPDDRAVPMNGKLGSLHPVRTGVLVQDGKAYFAASLLPWRQTWLCALDARTGTAEGAGLFKQPHESMTAQGPMLASASNLYIPQGRQRPVVFNRTTGQLVQSIGGSGVGGVFGLLTEDSMFIHGLGQNHRADAALRLFGGQKKDLLVTFPQATSIVIQGGTVYMHVNGSLQAFNRDKYVSIQRQINQLERRRRSLEQKSKKLRKDAAEADRKSLDDQMRSTSEQIATLQASLPSCFLWRVSSDCPLTLILAGQTLLAGGQDKVAAYDAATGRLLWTSSVKGRAYGLAVVNGSLLVSTDLGRIACFTNARVKVQKAQ